MLELDRLFQQLPSLKKFLDSYGSMSLYEYAQDQYSISEDTSPLAQRRKKELLDFLDSYVTKKFGGKYAMIVRDGLSRNYAVSTAEHHGPMGHPFFFQSALLRAITRPDLPVINFATSHVSLGNSSYPRGLVFHGDGNQAPKDYLHLPFFSSQSRMCPVFHFPAYTYQDIEQHCIQRLNQYHREKTISDTLYQKIHHYSTQYVLDESLITLSTYSEQITRLNHLSWQSLFPDLPPYISLDAEDIVTELLKKHLQDMTSFSRMVTDIYLQDSIEEHFNGISCCFDLTHHTGTYLFWYLDEHHKRHALWRQGDELVSQDKSFRIKMIHEEYLYHLEQKHLIPSGLLVYTLFACYYGLTCFGGFAQAEYLPKIQHAISCLTVEDTLLTQTSIFNEDAAFLYNNSMAISTIFDIDVTMNYSRLKSLSLNINLRDSVLKMEHEITRCL